MACILGMNRKIALVAGVGAAGLCYCWRRYNDRSGSKDRLAIVDKHANQEPDVVGPEDGVWVYFGTQSGTAETFANEIGDEAAEHGLTANVEDMEEFEPETFARHKVVVLVLATYGEGDPTDNAVEFFKWIQDDSLPSDTLEGVQFAVMGLGSRQYVNFNACGRMAEEHITRLGGELIHVRGEGDDDQDIEEDFSKWKDGGLWAALQQACGVEAPADAKHAGDHRALETAEQMKAKCHLESRVYDDGETPPVDPLVQAGGSDVLGKWYFMASEAPVSVCKELRQAPDAPAGRTTKHIDIDIKHLPAFDWQTADNLEVLPRNTDASTEWFADRLNVADRLDSNITFVRMKGQGIAMDKVLKKPFPCPCSVRDALGFYCDFTAGPSRAQARKWAAFAENDKDRDTLTKLIEDNEAYRLLVVDGRLGLQEFFELFLPSAEIDLGTFLQLCPRQKSRAYTIASSSREDSKTIGLCVSMVTENAPDLVALIEELASRGHEIQDSAARVKKLASRLGEGGSRVLRGLCSTMLCTQIDVGDTLMIYNRASSFRLPKKSSVPVVMIGAGTGMAPFRGFIREFVAEGGKRSKTYLFFGCTSSTVDYLYQEELQEALALEPPALTELVTAFSREQAYKIYVQHVLKERAGDIAKLVDDGAYFYVCGATSMGKSIREELAAVLGSTERLEKIIHDGRFVEELW